MCFLIFNKVLRQSETSTYHFLVQEDTDRMLVLVFFLERNIILYLLRKECAMSCITKLYSINNNREKRRRRRGKNLLSFSPSLSLSLARLLIIILILIFALFVDNNIHSSPSLRSTYILRFNPHLLPSQHSSSSPSFSLSFSLSINVHTIILSNTTFLWLEKMTFT